MTKERRKIEKHAYDIVERSVYCRVDDLINDYSILEEKFDQYGDLYDEYEEPKEVMEYWAVDGWLANKLIDKGEIIYKSFFMNIWARTTSGQAIYIDGVMEEIAEEDLI